MSGFIHRLALLTHPVYCHEAHIRAVQSSMPGQERCLCSIYGRTLSSTHSPCSAHETDDCQMACAASYSLQSSQLQIAQ